MQEKESTASATATQQQAAEPEKKHTLTVLIAEDDLVTRKMVTSVLKKRGYQILEAKNGVEALQTLSSTVPDVFIIDMNMPEMNGIDLLRKIRQNKKLITVPVIFLTANRDKRAIMQVANLGIDAYLAKPVNLNMLQSKIEEVTRPESVHDRLKNMLNIVEKQIKQIEIQKKHLSNELTVQEKHLSDLEHRRNAELEKVKSSGTPREKALKKQQIGKLNMEIARQKEHVNEIKSRFGRMMKEFQHNEQQLQQEKQWLTHIMSESHSS